jgi:hypothetical protein
MHFVTVVMHEWDMRSPLKLWNTNKRHHIASIGGLARLERLPEKPAEELIVALAGPLVNVFLAIMVFL